MNYDLFLQRLAQTMGLGDALSLIRDRQLTYSLVDHWQQGEFHHDILIELTDATGEAPPFLIIATNCNGGVKEVLAFSRKPDRWALWNYRCPENPEFDGELSGLQGEFRTTHWFDPCLLLTPDARSELKPEARERCRGGGWKMRS